MIPTFLLLLPLAGPPASDKLPVTRLKPAVLFLEQCVYRYRIATPSPKCQDYFDQALGYYYSYVWMEAARSFETAVRHDPECAMAHWGLARALERFGRGNANASYQKAWDLRAKADPREQMLLRASMEEKGLIPGVGDGEARKKKAIATIDELLATYDDDEEAWWFRAQLAGGSGLFGGQASSVPFYKALLRINPLHPGASHELVHFYENFGRPALGWKYAEAYIESSPGIPHPFHMQAHLATRLGRWKLTAGRSARAVVLERAYHKRENVKPKEDGQFQHHLDILLLALIHEGRFAEGRAIMKEMQECGWENRETFFRLLLAERDYPAALAMADKLKAGGGGKGKGRRRGGANKGAGAYCAALAHLAMKEPSRALPEL
ncbi:MAG: hypothetical protein K2W96_12270, partial [Gemmataceae bacterium]|nr:hypothetical protein [Gemmataceae bacterium]